MRDDLLPGATAGSPQRALPILIVGCILGCTPAPPAVDHQGSRPNVLLITVDTLRADRLGAYGGAAETPNLDRLAMRGTVFDNAVAPVPSTRPSHFTILTGRHPRRHGVLSNADSLAEGIVTLPMVFHSAGYETAGFTGTRLLAPGSGAERGFEVFDAPGSGRRVAGEVVDSALEWIRPRLESPPLRPWFLWVHVYDPHIPYGPPGEQTSVPPQLPEGTTEFSRPMVKTLLAGGDGELPDWLFQYALSRYRDEIEYADRQLGRLLEAVHESGTLDRTLVLLTADHGECFENGFYFEHGPCLHEGAVRVPLILSYPPVVEPGTRSTGLVELAAVAATVLRLAGLPNLDGAAQETLFDAAADPAFLQRPVYGESVRRRRSTRMPYLQTVAGDPLARDGGEPQVAARTDEWKLLWDGEDGVLYDLRGDASETVDRAAERPDVVRELFGLLAQWERSHPLIEPDSELDPEHEALLRSLGYL